MAVLTWDQTGQKIYETGVDHGVLYIPDNSGAYPNGYAWNGLTTVTESPEGAEPNAQYADNIKYLNLLSAEEVNGTIEAFTYPDQFGQCDGTAEPQAGVRLGQQTRKSFGLSYRSKVGNDVAGTDYGYKLHLIYGALAAPSEKAYATVNDSPEAISFSWEFTTTPVSVTGYKPTALLTIDSTKATPANLATLEQALYGTAGTNPRLPLPDEVLAMFAGSVTSATPTAPTYTPATHTITIPTVTGVTYKRADTGATVTGSVVLTTGQQLIIRAVPNAGYSFPDNTDDDWQYTY